MLTYGLGDNDFSRSDNTPSGPDRCLTFLRLLIVRKEGSVKTKLWVVITAGLILLTSTFTAEAQQPVRRWGVGTFLAYNSALFSLRDQYTGGAKYGLNWHYSLSPRVYIEAEYHRSEFERGKLEDAMFTWTVDGKDYRSPNASAEMRFSSGVVNLLIFHQAQPSFKSGDFVYYFQVGGGFYDYKSERRNFVYPGQKTKPLDVSVVLPLQIDARAALSAHAGFGVQAFAFDKIAVDLRARYHIVMGDVRPMIAFGVEKKTFPIQLLDLVAGLKFYFWK
jgi:hypothetical protein